jgi:hypothetical protein
MPANRLVDDKGVVIGAVVIDRKSLVTEIVNGRPEIRLGYSTSPSDVEFFVFDIIPPEENE